MAAGSAKTVILWTRLAFGIGTARPCCLARNDAPCHRRCLPSARARACKARSFHGATIAARALIGPPCQP
eukprot:6148323-Pyramimonas_sp.AAC.1